jgi:hypothetical protein
LKWRRICRRGLFFLCNQNQGKKNNIKNRLEDKNERTNRKIIIKDTDDLPVILSINQPICFLFV